MARINREIIQGSAEWLALRLNYIGASDAASIMGVSPYKTAYQCWREKLGFGGQKTNANMAYGRSKEGEIRCLFEAYIGESFESALAFHEEIPYLMASLDGLSADGRISAEMKAANAKDHETARMGRVPEKYVPQCQHQMVTLDHRAMFYVSYHKGEIIVILVLIDLEYVEKLKKAEEEFWMVNVQQMIPPPQLRKKNGKD